MMGHNCMGNLREGVSRSANKWTKITEGVEETSAVTGRDCCEDHRQKDGFWYREHQTTRNHCEE